MLVNREIYGQDADGNRGIPAYYAELEESDIDWIVTQVEEQFEPDKKYYTVFNEDEYGREFEFEISFEDWFNEIDYKEMEGNYYDK